MDDTEYLPSEEDLQASHIQGTRDRERSVQLVHFQTCGRGAVGLISGPVPDPDPSINKQKNLEKS